MAPFEVADLRRIIQYFNFVAEQLFSEKAFLFKIPHVQLRYSFKMGKEDLSVFLASDAGVALGGSNADRIRAWLFLRLAVQFRSLKDVSKYS